MIEKQETPTIVEILRSVTPSQKKRADDLANILHTLGFEADDLDDMIYRLAESYGDASPGDSARRDRQVDAEITAADELNMDSMVRQIELLAAHYVTHDALLHALEIALSVDFGSNN